LVVARTSTGMGSTGGVAMVCACADKTAQKYMAQKRQ
jgi:hypothetical protein